MLLGFISQPGAVKIQLTKPVQTSGQQTPNALTSKPKYQLRSKPQTLSDEDIQIMIKKYNFFCKRYDWSEKWYNESGRFKNDYEDNGNGTVTDHATGLMWQKFGSKDYMSHDNAEKYINGLNRQRVAGYDNWRLPTVEELMSLLENKEMNGDFYISPLFDKKQRWCWSSDRCGSGGWWGVLFTHGRIDWYVSDLYYVRGVRH